MKSEYIISGMTCQNCVNKVKTALEESDKIVGADVNLAPQKTIIKSNNELDIKDLQSIVSSKGEYTIQPVIDAVSNDNEAVSSWFFTYKPLLLVLGYILLVTMVVVSTLDLTPKQAFMTGMRYFMAGFFIVFSFFKMLDLRGFRDSYTMYDVLAKRWPAYGYIYPFLELILGLAFLVNFEIKTTLITTIILMGFSSIGVIQAVLDERRIKCACLGTGFNLPMTTVTIIEDLMMVGMSFFMLLNLP